MYKKVKVASAIELQQLFQTATAEGTPVYVYRQGEGIQVDLREMNRIVEIDKDNLVATVEPGVKLKDLAEELQRHGLRFVPAELVGLEEQTVGEWVYTGCANPLAWKYGGGKFFVMGGEFVLPDGRLLVTGGKTVKNVTGYDFVRFLNGAYADFAVGVKFLLKLLPQAAATCCLELQLPTLAKTLAFVEELRQRPAAPAGLFWLDEAVQRQVALGDGQKLWLRFDGVQEEVAEQAAWAREAVCEKQGQVLGESAGLPALSAFSWGQAFLLTDEYKVPFPQVGSFLTKALQAGHELGLQPGFFGQLGEGKLHLVLPSGAPIPAELVRQLQCLAREFGGASSGKFERLYGIVEQGPLTVIEQQMKKRFDPRGVLNRQGGVRL